MFHVFALVLLFCGASSAQVRKALIVDGQNNHQWQLTTPILKKILEETKLFNVDVATSPAKGADMSGFQPNFAAYDIVVSNYNGDPWPPATRKAFTDFVRKGGGVVIVHAANNAFPEWKEFNEMIALGGWGNRDEKAGPYVRFRDGKFTRDTTAGRGGSHGAQHEFRVDIRNIEHPITKGLPPSFMHAKDELYDRLRGPAGNLTVLATAYSEVSTKGTGEHEPILMTIKYGGGRVFHTTLGHSPEAMSCVGFIVTLQRGAEWAATGKVKQKLPQDYPMGQVSTRKID
ncbi:MAG: ThuA domain-containing protein [Bryobacteraceae bacterium]|nr:ThuA domain-containing protein [Bryobacteraceae bacterium]